MAIEQIPSSKPKEQAKTLEGAPAGWFTKNEVIEEARKRGFLVSQKTLFPLIESFRTNHPEWFIEQPGRHGLSGLPFERLSPELLEEVCKILPPSTWPTIKGAAD